MNDKEFGNSRETKTKRQSQDFIAFAIAEALFIYVFLSALFCVYSFWLFYLNFFFLFLLFFFTKNVQRAGSIGHWPLPV